MDSVTPSGFVTLATTLALFIRSNFLFEISAVNRTVSPGKYVSLSGLIIAGSGEVSLPGVGGQAGLGDRNHKVPANGLFPDQPPGKELRPPIIRKPAARLLTNPTTIFNGS